MTLLAVGVLYRQLDKLHRLFFGQYAGDQEKGCLHNDVDASAQANGIGQFDAVNHVEFQLFTDNLLLDFFRQFFPDFILVVGAVEQEGASLNYVVKHIKAVDKAEVVASQEIGLFDQVGAADGGLAEA